MGDVTGVSSSHDELLATRGIRKVYGHAEALSSVDFTIRRGEKVCILGPSGSGKTTLLRCLNLLVEPTAGELYFKGELVGAWPAAGRQKRRPPSISVTKYRSRVGMVFQ